MSGSESAGIWVGNRLAARVRLTPEDPVLTYTDDWKAAGFALSPALPLTGSADSLAVTAFFENMLPEGRAFENLVLATQISAGNRIGLALALGFDLPGVVRLTADASGEIRETIRPVTAAEISARIEAPDMHPMDLWDNRPRVTVAGAQPKLNLLMTDGRYALAEGTTIASDRILKFEPKSSPFLTINEFLSLELAHALGHPVAQARLFRLGEHRVLEVFRFDRKTELRGGKKRVWRRHVIDACQALGLTSAYKYERPFGDGRDVAAIRTGVSLVRLFSLVRFADPALRAQTAASLLDWLLFNTVIGNTDAHGKNFSFFGGKNGLSPAPWYNLVSVLQVDGVSHSLAMAVGDEFDPAELHALQLLSSADDIGIPRKWLEKQLRDVIARLTEALPRADLFVEATLRLTKEEADYVRRWKAFIGKRLRYWEKESRILPELTL